MTFFSECACIPVYENHKLLSFEARPFKPRGKKVLYPKCSSVNTLYQYELLDREAPLFFTEGLMDMFSLRTAGNHFANSTCMFHCNPTERQIYLFKEYFRGDLIYVIDNDRPGMMGCLKLMEAIPGNRVGFLKPPATVKDVNDILQGKDPRLKSVASLLRRGWTKGISKDETALRTMIAQIS